MSVARAFVEALRLAVPGRQVWDGMPNPDASWSEYDQIDPDGYVVAYAADGDRLMTNIGGTVDGRDVRVYTHCFGPSRDAAGWLSGRLVDWVTTHGIDVPEFGTARVMEHHTQTPVTDDDVPGEPLVRIYDDFRFLITAS